MKKIILFLTMLLTLVCTVCFAADGGDLNKQQKTAEKFIDAIDGAPVPEYTVIAPLLNENLAKSLGEKGYANLQKAVQEKFGKMESSKFVSFQRFDQADRVTYTGNFSKEKVVIMIFVFDKQSKMIDFLLTPYREPANEAAKDAAK